MSEFLKKLKLSDKVYDILKWIAQFLLPGLGTFYFALARTWGLPYGYEMLGTITALDTFLGLLLGVSTTNYTGDGMLKIDTSQADKDTYRLDMDVPLDSLKDKKTVTLKVDSNANLQDSKG